MDKNQQLLQFEWQKLYIHKI